MTGRKAVTTVGLAALAAGWLALVPGAGPVSGATTAEEGPRITDAAR